MARFQLMHSNLPEIDCCSFIRRLLKSVELVAYRHSVVATLKIRFEISILKEWKRNRWIISLPVAHLCSFPAIVAKKLFRLS